MAKKANLVILFSVLILLLIIAWLEHRSRTPTQQPEASALSDSSKETVDFQVTTKRPVPSREGIVISNLPPGIPLGFRSGIRADLIERAFDDWRTPINFYGKVVDEHGNPVEGATINFGWTDLSPDGYSRATTTSDANGLFSLEGRTGKHLSVHVSKDGYYTSRSNVDSFFYAGENENFVPDQSRPVIFYLRKKGKGEMLIQKDFPPGIGQIWQLRADGTAIELDLLNGTKAQVGSGQLRLEFWRDVSDRKAHRFAWTLRLSVPRGGISKTDEEFAFEAPPEGYQPSFVIEMPASNHAWRDNITAKFYVRLADGKFGRIDLYFLGYNGVFTVHSAINPTGARNLEPKD